MSNQTDAQLLADKMAIQEVLNEYCLRLEINPFEEWLDLFTDDTVYEVYGKVLEGRDAVGGMLSKAPHGIHIGGATRIELQGDTAETVQNYTFLAEEPSASNHGWYHRTLTRTDEGWKISYTKVTFLKSTKKG